MATESFHCLTMGKVNIEKYCYLTADIVTKVLQKYLLSGPPLYIAFLTKSLNLIGCHSNLNVRFAKKYLKNQLLRSC